MKDRRHKIHYAAHARHDIGMCGVSGHITYTPNTMTCRICMFRYLAAQAPWAQGFLDELRGRVGRGQPAAVTVPAAGPEPVDRIVERVSHNLGRPFRPDGGSQKGIRELLPVTSTLDGAIQPVMNNSWPPAQPVWIQPGQVAEQPGDAGQVSYEPRRYNKYSE